MILVTGGTGYLGSHLANRLLARREKVRVFDVEERKYLPPGADFVRGDMKNIADVRRAMEGVERVIHCAFLQSLSKRPEDDKWVTNIAGTDNFLRAAAERKVAKFVHTSTIEIYGVKPPVPCGEDAPTDEPTGWYGRHKLECEWLCRKYIAEGLPVTMLRLPIICGPGHYNHGPFLDVMDRIIEGKPLPVVGAGGPRGSAVHLDDTIDAFLLALDKPEATGEAFNVAAEIPATHREIMEAMARAAGRRLRLIPIPRFSVFPLVRLANRHGLTDCPDHQIGYLLNDCVFSIEKAKRLLGYAPKFTTAQAFENFIYGYMQDREYVRARSRSY
ncbi:MAG TPA: NAD(P)-dependent oxidoreductase [Candidatus Brocadiia bacterium]|nr:NAD(P)-dependent oxidoreductase [Candidatus Brocadiia bacterium]